MRSEEILDVFTSSEFEHVFSTQEGFEPGDVVDHDRYLEIANSGVFPVLEISSKRNREATSVDVYHEDGRIVGHLLLLKGRLLEDFYTLTQIEFFVYLSDVSRDEFGNLGYIFTADYFVTSDVPAAEYDQNLRPTSDIWGEFSHYSSPSCSSVPFVDIMSNSRIALPSLHHSEAFARYTYARTAFERFLRLYHAIELIFDTITVLRIKKLGNDLREFSRILSSHDSKEVDRLISIANEFIYDHERLAQRLTLISGYEPLAKEIFDDNSKHGNPIAPSANPPRWTIIAGSLGAGRYKEVDLKGHGALKADENYKMFVCRISAYWIYRVRCSIAHSRIGEFILSDADTYFVEDFAEPLLHEFCAQVFSSQALKDLL